MSEFDWQAAEIGLRGWLMAIAPADAAHVAWVQEPVGYRSASDGTRDQWDLAFSMIAKLEGHRDSVSFSQHPTYPDREIATVTGQRSLMWMVTLTTRDQHAAHKAYAQLDRLRTLLSLPRSFDLFRSLGLTLGDTHRIDPEYSDEAHRKLSVATLGVEFFFVQSIRDPDIELGATDWIEHVMLRGKFYETREAFAADAPDVEIPVSPQQFVVNDDGTLVSDANGNVVTVDDPAGGMIVSDPDGGSGS